MNKHKRYPSEFLDLLRHHAATLNIKGEHYRLKEKREAGLLGHAPMMNPEQLAEADWYPRWRR